MSVRSSSQHQGRLLATGIPGPSCHGHLGARLGRPLHLGSFYGRTTKPHISALEGLGQGAGLWWCTRWLLSGKPLLREKIRKSQNLCILFIFLEQLARV